jgi:Uma2 family endonuclease
MADTLRHRWTLEEFLAWEERQESRHEFVDGVVRAMVGGTQRHNMIALNVASYLRRELRGKKCRPFGTDMKIATPAGNVRYPDVTVDCGAIHPNESIATEPTVAVEVLSKSTAWADQTHKLDEYQSVPSMRHVLHLVQERAEGELWTRAEAGWLRAPLNGLDAEVNLTAINVKFALSGAYEDIEFDPDPSAQNDNRDAPS